MEIGIIQAGIGIAIVFTGSMLWERQKKKKKRKNNERKIS